MGLLCLILRSHIASRLARVTGSHHDNALLSPLVDKTFVRELGRWNATCRYFAPDRDMELVLNINPHPETWADFLKKTGFDGSQDVEYIRGIYT